jgi:gamma-glutamylcyclotransferase (GGCT)/AIG2-like uncharacterized protein YtfP
MADTIHYFAYGSNLDIEQMQRRCPSSRFVCRARLVRHRVTFPLPCESWGGGVAGIDPDPNRDVHGVVYVMTQADLGPLDRYENVAGGDYERREVEVVAESGESMRVWTYFCLPAPDRCPPPSRRYLEAILRGARYHGLPESYIADLAATPTADDGRSEFAFDRG